MGNVERAPVSKSKAFPSYTLERQMRAGSPPTLVTPGGGDFFLALKHRDIRTYTVTSWNLTPGRMPGRIVKEMALDPGQEATRSGECWDPGRQPLHIISISHTSVGREVRNESGVALEVTGPARRSLCSLLPPALKLLLRDGMESLLSDLYLT